MEARKLAQIIPVVQGTPEWHAWRKTGFGGSDAPVIEGISPYKTLRELFADKRTPAVVEDESKQFIFSLGKKTEAKVRYEIIKLVFEKTGFVIELNQECVRHPDFPYVLASLDGYDSHLQIIEAKLVGKDDLKEAAKNGNIPAHHYSQIMHQIWAKQCEVARWCGHDGKDGRVYLEIKRNEEYLKRYSDKVHKTWMDLKAGLVPPLTERDYKEIDEARMQELRDAKEAYANAETYYELIKKGIIEEFGDHPKLAGAGVKLFKVKKAGSLKLLDVPEIAAACEKVQGKLDENYLEKFRSKGSESWTVNISKK
jgi:putative phage-type endonuclease